MFYLLIRAYFDQCGKFEGIEKTFFGSSIIEAANSENISVIEYCCRALGYTADNIYSAEERMIRRSLAVNTKDVQFLNLFPEGAVKKSMLKANGLQPYFTTTLIKVPDELKDIVETIVNFIEHTEMIAIFDKKKGVHAPLRKMFFDLKLARDEEQLEGMIPQYLDAVMMILRNVEILEGIEHSYAAGGKIYLAHDIQNVGDLALHICRHLGRRSLVMPASHYYFLTSNMSYYQLTDPIRSNAYVRLLDLASIYKKTIAELIQYAGFTFINQFDVYRAVGYFVYELPGSRYVCVNPFDNEDKLELSYADLKEYYRPGGLMYV